MGVTKLSRRKFIAATGGVTFAIAGYPLFGKFLNEEKGVKSEQVTAWVHIENTGKITIYNPASEMGQGSMTALAALVAEEMDADWSQVRIEHSPIEPSVYGRGWGRGRGRGGSMITVGSYTVRGYYANLRHAGAQVRYVLRSSAADKWGVPLNEVTTEPGQVLHTSSGRSASFGEIVDYMKVPDAMPEIPESDLKKPSEFRIIGEDIPRYDIPEKTNGKAMYAMDIQVPGMVYAIMSRSPVHGSRPKLNNDSAIREMEGVLDIVTLEHGVAVVAESIFAAMEARKQFDITWTGGANAKSHSSEDAWSDYDKIAGNDQAGWSSVENTGDVEQVFSENENIITRDYQNDYIYHAQMEPLNAVVSVAPDGQSAEVWVGSQAHDGARATAAEVLGLDFTQVKLNPHYLGGGFGRRSMSDYVAEATVIANQVKKPVKLIWTREDDLKYGAFRPMSLQRMQAIVEEDGNITAWRHRIIGPGGGLLASGAKTDFYTFANQRVEMKDMDHGIRTKHWRAVGHGPNKFAIESFIDELATEKGVDPVVMRKQLMRNHSRAINVLENAVEMSDWGGQVPAGRARGIGFGERSESLVAGVCEISLDEATGRIVVHKVWAALDAGLVVQPNNAIAQMEGSINMGISSILKERITFVNGEVKESNFNDYGILRISEAPEFIDIRIIPSAEPPAGIGEAGLPWLASAIAQAFYNLTGKRLRHMPFTPEKIKSVLG